MPVTMTASQLYRCLSCPHRVARDVFADAKRRDPVRPLVDLLWERGTAKEALASKTAGKPCMDLSGLRLDPKEPATRGIPDRRSGLAGRIAAYSCAGAIRWIWQKLRACLCSASR